MESILFKRLATVVDRRGLAFDLSLEFAGGAPPQQFSANVK